MLNWTLEAVITLVSGAPILTGAILLANRYIQHRDRLLLLLTTSWLIHLIYMISFGISYLFMAPWIMRVNVFLLVINTFVLTILFDLMNNQQLDPIKTAIATVLGIITIYTAFLENSVIVFYWPNGAISYTTSGNYRIAIAVTAAYMGLLYLYYATKILLDVPQHLRIWAWINLVGVLIFSEVVVIFYALNLTNIIPGIATLLSALGGILSIYAFVQSPQLIYVLPFTTYRLIVIDSTAGTTLYSFNWVTNDKIQSNLPVDLISSALSGLNAFATEAIGMGSIKEMLLERAVLYIKSSREEHLQFVLIASSISRVLRHNLDRFADLFIMKFVLARTNNYSITTNFLQADLLIDEAFPYIPKERLPKETSSLVGDPDDRIQTTYSK